MRTVLRKRCDGTTYAKKVSNKYTSTSFQPTSGKRYIPRTDNVTEVVEYLGTFREPFTMTEVIDSKDLSMSRLTAFKVMKSLEEEGRISKSGKKYILTDTQTGETAEQPITETVSQEEDNDEQDQDSL